MFKGSELRFKAFEHTFKGFEYTFKRYEHSFLLRIRTFFIPVSATHLPSSGYASEPKCWHHSLARCNHGRRRNRHLGRSRLNNGPSPHIPSCHLPAAGCHPPLAYPYPSCPDKDRKPSCFCLRQHDRYSSSPGSSNPN